MVPCYTSNMGEVKENGKEQGSTSQWLTVKGK